MTITSWEGTQAVVRQKEPVLLEAVRAAKADALDEFSRLVVGPGRTAVATLAKAMSDPVFPPLPECERPMPRSVGCCN